MNDKDPMVFVGHVLETINKIEKFSAGLTRETLATKELQQYAVVRGIEIIGEAIKNIPLSIKNKYPAISWKDIAGTRDILIHHYFGVDLNIVWDIVANDLPKLKREFLIVKEDLLKT
ncbi:DUF86 domain-containing protein [Candidatus Woesearchaeota archaeon]|nr:DUF86 domain-containing protein [Candidatus Woesearchaeota archaeon]